MRLVGSFDIVGRAPPLWFPFDVGGASGVRPWVPLCPLHAPWGLSSCREPGKNRVLGSGSGPLLRKVAHRFIASYIQIPFALDDTVDLGCETFPLFWFLAPIYLTV